MMRLWQSAEHGTTRDAATQATVTTQAGEDFNAKKVIVSVPLGFLQQHHSSMFTPSLPDSHLQAMQTLGMGTLNKVGAQGL